MKLLISTLVILFTACVGSESPKSTYKNGNSRLLLPLKMSIETAGNGSGSAPNLTNVAAGVTQTFFAVLRDQADTFAGLASANWSVSANIGTISGAATGTSVAILFTGDGRNSLGSDTGVVGALHAAYTPDQETATVVAGAATQIVAETAADGSGTEYTTGSIVAGDVVNLFAVSRDAYNNYVGNPSITWTKSSNLGTFAPTGDGGVTGTGTTTAFTATTTGVLTITADHATLTDDTTGNITVGPGVATYVSIETNAAGTGAAVGAVPLVSGAAYNLFLVTRDAYNNYVGTDSATWSVPGGIGTFSPSGDGGLTGSGAAVAFTAGPPGAQSIYADHLTLTDDTTGVFTVTNNRPVLTDNQVFYTDLNTNLNFTVTPGTDADAHAITYSQVTAPASGTMTACMDLAGSAGGTDLTCTFAPAMGFTGKRTFTYRAFDSYEYSLLDSTLTIFVRANHWTWSNSAAGPANTDTTSDSAGVYGAVGVASNTFQPGTRQGSATWKDSSGNFWLMGGEGHDSAGNLGTLNDLWRFDSTTGIWTWMAGLTTRRQGSILSSLALGGTDAQVTPGARKFSAAWVVNNGVGDDDLYLFGGQGAIQATATIAVINNAIDATDTLTVQGINFQETVDWAVGATAADTAVNIASAINASANMAIDGVISAYADGATAVVTLYADAAGTGGNAFTTVETDNATDNFTLSGATFTGGTDEAALTGYFNDLWKFNTLTGLWTVVKRSTTENTSQDGNGTYGVITVDAALNIPPPRRATGAWTYTTPNPDQLYLFSGEGRDSTGTTGMLNDVWRFDIGTGNWTWMKGENLASSGATYGTLGTAAALNTPGSRYGATSWQDSSNLFWLFGGFGFPASGGSGYLSDLWRYDPASNNWTWIKGPNTRSNLGTYGVQGTAATGNLPGGRIHASAVVDADNRAFIFGGYGYSSAGGLGYLNDLWSWDGSTNWTWMKGANTLNSMGTHGVLATANAANEAGARQAASAWLDANGYFWLFGGLGYDENSGPGYLFDLMLYTP